jgi:hypothetical protein
VPIGRCIRLGKHCSINGRRAIRTGLADSELERFMMSEKPIEITPEMVEAGAEVIRGDRYDLGAEELAKVIFAAMAAVSTSRMLPGAAGPIC